MATEAVGSGLASQLLVKDESTWGVAPSLASGTDSFEFNSESLELKKTTVVGQGLAAGHVHLRTKRRVLTNYDYNGDINMDLPTRGMHFWCRHMTGSFGQTLATPTQIASSGIYKSVHWPGTTEGHSFTVQKGVPATDTTVEPFTGVGCKLTGWEVSISTGGLAALTLHVDGRNELGGSGNGDPLNGSVPALATWAVPTSGLGTSVFHFREATVFTGGTPTVTSGIVSLTGATAAGSVRDANVQYSIPLDTNRVFIGGNGFKSEQVENGYRGISGSMTVDWLSSEALYNAYSADTTSSLQLTFVGPTVSGQTYLFDIIIPNIKFDGESPKVQGPGVVQTSTPFTGYDDETTTPLQITYQSEDSTV